MLSLILAHIQTTTRGLYIYLLLWIITDTLLYTVLCELVWWDLAFVLHVFMICFMCNMFNSVCGLFHLAPGQISTLVIN